MMSFWPRATERGKATDTSTFSFFITCDVYSPCQNSYKSNKSMFHYWVNTFSHLDIRRAAVFTVYTLSSHLELASLRDEETVPDSQVGIPNRLSFPFGFFREVTFSILKIDHLWRLLWQHHLTRNTGGNRKLILLWLLLVRVRIRTECIRKQNHRGRSLGYRMPRIG